MSDACRASCGSTPPNICSRTVVHAWIVSSAAAMPSPVSRTHELRPSAWSGMRWTSFIRSSRLTMLAMPPEVSSSWLRMSVGLSS